MLKTILVGLNWSRASRAAGELAVTWAKQHDAEMLGVGVVDLSAFNSQHVESSAEPFHPLQRAGDASPTNVDLAEAHRQVDALLMEFEWTCLSAQVPATVVKKEGSAGSILSRDLQRADLIVVGLSRNPGDSPAAPLSITLDKLLSNAIHPVVCVPESVTRGHGVLVACDGSLQAARALFAFVGLELFPNEIIRLVSVDQTRGQHTEALTHADQYLKAHGYRTEVEQLSVGPGGVAETLIQHIQSATPRLVVAGVFGKSWTRSVLCGSVTKRLLHEGCAPMFVYH